MHCCISNCKCPDHLLDALELAKTQKDEYKSLISKIEKINLEPIKEFIPFEYQSKSISFVKKHLNEIESLLDSVSLWKEITNKSYMLFQVMVK